MCGSGGIWQFVGEGIWRPPKHAKQPVTLVLLDRPNHFRCQPTLILHRCHRRPRMHILRCHCAVQCGLDGQLHFRSSGHLNVAGYGYAWSRKWGEPQSTGSIAATGPTQRLNITATIITVNT
jgi:hypothetical protein